MALAATAMGQHCQSASTSTTTMNSSSLVGINGSLAVGDKLVAICDVGNTTGQTISSVLLKLSGSTVGTFSSSGVSHTSSKSSVEMWYWDSTSTIADISTYTLVATWGASSNAGHAIELHKITGGPAAGAPPQSNTNGVVGSGTAWNGGAVTPTNTGCIVFAHGMCDSSVSQTPTTTFTMLDQFGITGSGSALPSIRPCSTVYNLPGSLSPITLGGTWISNSVGWDAMAWTWNPASATATPQPGFRFSF